MMRAPWSVGHHLASGRATVMENSVEQYDALIRSGARRLTGYQRRSFQAEVVTALCGGTARQGERRFGWGRDTVEKGLNEERHGVRCLENFAARGRVRSEREGPATGGRSPCHRRAPYVRRSGTQVGAAVHESVGGRAARRLDREGPSQSGVAQRADPAGHPQADELPP